MTGTSPSPASIVQEQSKPSAIPAAVPVLPPKALALQTAAQRTKSTYGTGNVAIPLGKKRTAPDQEQDQAADTSKGAEASTSNAAQRPAPQNAQPPAKRSKPQPSLFIPKPKKVPIILVLGRTWSKRFSSTAPSKTMNNILSPLHCIHPDHHAFYYWLTMFHTCTPPTYTEVMILIYLMGIGISPTDRILVHRLLFVQ